MEYRELKSKICGTLQDENRCPEPEVDRHWTDKQPFEPPPSLFDQAAVLRLNAICEACDLYTPRKD